MDTIFLSWLSKANTARVEQEGSAWQNAMSRFLQALIILWALPAPPFHFQNAIVFYTVDIFEDAGSTLDPKIATIIVGLVQVAASIVAAILMDKAGRRVLLLLSGFLMSAALCVLGGFFYMQEEDPSVKDNLGWLPLLCLMVFIVAFSLGNSLMLNN